MNLYVFALYNSYMDVYDIPIFHKYDKEETLEIFRRMVLDDPEKAFKQHFDEKVLCFLGEYDDRTGILIPFENPQSVSQLAGLFPKGFLAKKEQEKQLLSQALMEVPHAGN